MATNIYFVMALDEYGDMVFLRFAVDNHTGETEVTEITYEKMQDEIRSNRD
jgi:hypothetical protein